MFRSKGFQIIEVKRRLSEDLHSHSRPTFSQPFQNNLKRLALNYLYPHHLFRKHMPRIRICSQCGQNTEFEYDDHEWEDRGYLCEYCEEEIDE